MNREQAHDLAEETVVEFVQDVLGEFEKCIGAIEAICPGGTAERMFTLTLLGSLSCQIVGNHTSETARLEALDQMTQALMDGAKVITTNEFNSEREEALS